MSDEIPILAPSGASATLASRPAILLECERYPICDANPAPWWVSALWLFFFVFAFSDLVANLLQLG
jgi:hypothetical protein